MPAPNKTLCISIYRYISGIIDCAMLHIFCILIPISVLILSKSEIAENFCASRISLVNSAVFYDDLSGCNVHITSDR